MSSKRSPGCKRITIDIPEAMHSKLEANASAPPKISVAEYVRRVLAGHLGYPMPPASDRAALKMRVDGKPKAKTGPKVRDHEAHL
jgi:hypothetical protein